MIVLKLIGKGFSSFFILISMTMIVYMLNEFVKEVLGGEDFLTAMLQLIGTAVVALAVFELGVGISKELPSEARKENVYSNVRRTTTRFCGTVAIALVLESLILVIKYSQLELAGNLYYPVAILCSAGVLLVSLGGFLNLTHRESVQYKLS